MSVRDLAHFETWLTECGAEVLDTGSEWEVLRVRTSTGTHVVYSNRAGKQRWPAGLLAIVSDYNAGRTPALAATRKGKARSKTRERYAPLVKRDGSGCFYCGEVVETPGTYDAASDYEATTEHLVSRAHGGPNHISNCYLAHRGCNAIAGSLSAPEKIALRERMRGAA